MSITPVSLVNVSKKMVSKQGSAVSELAQTAMSHLEGVTPAKAKKVLPKPIEGDQFAKNETKVKGLCGEWAMDSCGVIP